MDPNIVSMSNDWTATATAAAMAKRNHLYGYGNGIHQSRPPPAGFNCQHPAVNQLQEYLQAVDLIKPFPGAAAPTAAVLSSIPPAAASPCLVRSQEQQPQQSKGWNQITADIAAACDEEQSANQTWQKITADLTSSTIVRQISSDIQTAVASTFPLPKKANNKRVAVRGSTKKEGPQRKKQKQANDALFPSRNIQRGFSDDATIIVASKKRGRPRKLPAATIAKSNKKDKPQKRWSDTWAVTTENSPSLEYVGKWPAYVRKDLKAKVEALVSSKEKKYPKSITLPVTFLHVVALSVRWKLLPKKFSEVHTDKKYWRRILANRGFHQLEHDKLLEYWGVKSIEVGTTKSPRPKDVTFGNPYHYNNQGNVIFRSLIDGAVKEYKANWDPTSRFQIALRIALKIQQSDGRFLFWSKKAKAFTVTNDVSEMVPKVTKVLNQTRIPIEALRSKVGEAKQDICKKEVTVSPAIDITKPKSAIRSANRDEAKKHMGEKDVVDSMPQSAEDVAKMLLEVQGRSKDQSPRKNALINHCVKVLRSKNPPPLKACLQLLRKRHRDPDNSDLRFRKLFKLESLRRTNDSATAGQKAAQLKGQWGASLATSRQKVKEQLRAPSTVQESDVSEIAPAECLSSDAPIATGADSYRPYCAPQRGSSIVSIGSRTAALDASLDSALDLVGTSTVDSNCDLNNSDSTDDERDDEDSTMDEDEVDEVVANILGIMN